MNRLIVTDLDGTLIDHDTYSGAAAWEALSAAAAAGVPVVACSSKTRAEMHRLATAMPLDPAPLIAENGSVVWFPPAWPVLPDDAIPAPGAQGHLVVLGRASAELRPLLDGLSTSLGITLRPLSAMSLDDVMARTGLDRDAATLASAREYSEPFVIDGSEEPALAVLQEAARRLGGRVTRGGRFFHLLGNTDKGAAVALVRATCPAGHRALGLGDAPNDLGLLAGCDDAVIVPQPRSGLHPDLVRALPHARHAASPGPTGWNAAVLDWLRDTAA